MALLKRKGSFGSAEIWGLFREAGYLKPTHLQRRVVPLLVRGRDVAAEAEGDSGKTAAFILPILVRVRRGKAGIKAVVLTSSGENARKVFREFGRFSGSRSKPLVFAFGFEGLERKEHRILSKKPDVVIGTPNKVIDHIRRGNLDLSNLQMAVVDRSGDLEAPGFVEDVLFIHSKFPPGVQTLIIAPSLDGEMQPLVGLLKRPAVLPLSSWKDSGVAVGHLFFPVAPGQRQAALRALALTRPAESLLVQARDAQEVRKANRLLRLLDMKSLTLLEDLSPAQQNKACQSFSVGAASVLVSTFAAARKHDLKWVSHVINLDPPPDAESYRPRSFMLREVATLGEESQYSRLQEMVEVDVEKKELPSEEEMVEGSIRQLLARIKEREDPQELNRYRQIMRKNVPLPLRSYLLAYLLKQAASRGTEAPSRPKAKGFSKLFVSAGRNRRVFPRDLTELFVSRLGIQPSQIREVKVLDGYSFVEIDAAVAERAIAELSGTEIKGRTVTVDHARRKVGK